MIYLASFDIGKKNFAFCIEEIDKKELLDLSSIPLQKRYNKDGTCTEAMENLLTNIYSNGRIILHKNLDLTTNCDKKLKLDPESFFNMNDKLDKYKKYWEKCDVFIIEEQMSFGKKLNKMAVKLAQHCYSYFTFNYGRFKTVIEFPAYHKTQVLGAPKVKGKTRFKAMSQRDRKKWSVDKAIEILTSRGEIHIVDNMTQKKKLDDLADVLTQLQAFKFKVYVEREI